MKWDKITKTSRLSSSRSSRFSPSFLRRLWCKWRRPINYIGVLSWLRSLMGKLKAVAELFEGRHFDREVIILCVRWYLMPTIFPPPRAI